MNKMCAEIECGKCSICGKVGPVLRRYYYYGIDCECCSSPYGHFEIVWHCADCEPEPPRRIYLYMKPIKER